MIRRLQGNRFFRDSKSIDGTCSCLASFPSLPASRTAFAVGPRRHGTRTDLPGSDGLPDFKSIKCSPTLESDSVPESTMYARAKELTRS